MAKTKPITITAGARDFTTALALAVKFADDPRYGMPALAGVLLSEIDGHLHLQATDRYRAVIVRTDAEAPKGLRHLLDRDAVARIRRVFPNRAADPDLTITIDGGQVNVTSAPDGGEHLSITFPAPLVDLPAYPDLLPHFREGGKNHDPEKWSSLASRHLAQFADFGGSITPVKMWRRGAVTFVQSERALGVVMGVYSRDDATGDWSTVLGEEPAPVAEAPAGAQAVAS